MKKRTKAIAIAAILTLIFFATVIGPIAFFDKIVPILSPVLPRPDGVPRDATASYSLKDGVYWRWHGKLTHGCVSWLALNDIASVRLGGSSEVCEGKGLTLDYSSFDEHITFFAFTGEMYGGKPCPFTIPRTMIAEFQGVVDGAMKAAETRHERSMLRYIERRLVKVDGQRLTTDHTGGCNDLKIEDYSLPRKQHKDPWKSQ